MGDVGRDLCCSVLEERFGGIDERTAGIDDVVDQNAALAGDVADHIHDHAFTGTFAALVANGDGRFDAFGESTRTNHAADVG